MKLFENGVGRPSNETVKKRKIFTLIVTLIVVGLIVGVTFMLNSVNTKKIKGDTYQVHDISISASATGTYIRKLKIEAGDYNFWSVPYVYKKNSNILISYKIKNNTNDKAYYYVSSNGNVLKKGAISSGKTISKVLKTKTNLSETPGRQTPISIYVFSKDISNYITDNDIRSAFKKLSTNEWDMGVLYLLNEFSFDFYYNKNYINMLKKWPSYIRNDNGPSANINYYKNEFLQNMDVSLYSTDKTGEYKFESKLYNASAVKHFYKEFSYSNTNYADLNKTMDSYNKDNAKCVAINANSSKVLTSTMNISSRIKKRTNRIKVYDTSKNCNNDVYGTLSKGVIYDAVKEMGLKTK